MNFDPPTSTTPTLADIPATFATALNFANNTVSQSVQTLGLIHQARLTQQQRAVTVLTAQYGADSAQVKTAQAAVISSKTAVERISMVKLQVTTAAPQVAVTGWALYGHIYHAQLQPASAYTVFLVDEQNAYQRDCGFVYTGSDGSFQLNYSGSENAPALPQLFLQIANAKAQPVYLSATVFQPQSGVATYQDVTLPAGEPVIGDPPPEIRAISMPRISKP